MLLYMISKCTLLLMFVVRSGVRFSRMEHNWASSIKVLFGSGMLCKTQDSDTQ